MSEHIDPTALDAEIRQRITAQLAATTARRQTRRQQRAEFAKRRAVGLHARHTTKLARNQAAQSQSEPRSRHPEGETMHPGTTPPPACRCGHAEALHVIGNQQGQRVRKHCSAGANTTGERCPCPCYNPAPASVPHDTRAPVQIRESAELANPQDVPTDAPPRRSGRQCGYQGREQLAAANRALGAALTKLARDADPDARRAGALIAATMADLVGQAAHLARESTGPARRAAAQVQRQLPCLAARLDALRAELEARRGTPNNTRRRYLVSDLGTP